MIEVDPPRASLLGYSIPYAGDSAFLAPQPAEQSTNQPTHGFFFAGSVAEESLKSIIFEKNKKFYIRQ
jgi:hypothetical protein